MQVTCTLAQEALTADLLVGYHSSRGRAGYAFISRKVHDIGAKVYGPILKELII